MSYELNFKKVSHETHELEVISDGKVLYKKLLPTKDFFKHDLVHTAYHHFSQVGHFNPLTEDMLTEFYTGALHNVYDDPFDASKYLAGIISYASEVGNPVPEFLTAEFIQKVRVFCLDIFTRFKKTKTGETLKINL